MIDVIITANAIKVIANVFLVGTVNSAPSLVAQMIALGEENAAGKQELNGSVFAILVILEKIATFKLKTNVTTTKTMITVNK